MARLEELRQGTTVRGILPNCAVAVIDVKWYGADAVELTYNDPGGRLGNELLYRDRETTLEIVESGRPWSMHGDGGQFKLDSEAWLIRLAYLFDPVLAVHTSLVDPLPHQIRLQAEAYPSTVEGSSARSAMPSSVGIGSPYCRLRISQPSSFS
jgi:hypothetical protein